MQKQTKTFRLSSASITKLKRLSVKHAVSEGEIVRRAIAALGDDALDCRCIVADLRENIALAQMQISRARAIADGLS